jgi:hypothetical protein
MSGKQLSVPPKSPPVDIPGLSASDPIPLEGQLWGEYGAADSLAQGFKHAPYKSGLPTPQDPDCSFRLHAYIIGDDPDRPGNRVAAQLIIARKGNFEGHGVRRWLIGHQIEQGSESFVEVTYTHIGGRLYEPQPLHGHGRWQHYQVVFAR